MDLPALTIGIEEEYLLVDPKTRDLASDPPPELLENCKAELGESVSPEFLKCQIEVGTPVCQNISEAREHLIRLRTCIKKNAQHMGLELMAASTHPFASWVGQHHTRAPRYDKLNQDMGGVIRRMLICGMHVHAGIEDPDLRIDLMNQMNYFLPHLLALSASSPFWAGRKMGMMSYRTNVWDGMPRNGISNQFQSWGEYERLTQALIRAGAIEDASKIWWDLRPSAKFPTLEMRITDICPRLEDALTIAALYQCLLRWLARLKRSNMKWRIYPDLLLQENRFLAARNGVQEKLVDLGKSEMVQFSELMDEIIELVAEDAVALNCVAEVEHARTIVKRGSSASQQLATFDSAIANGDDEHEALCQVVDQIIEQTAQGL